MVAKSGFEPGFSGCMLLATESCCPSERTHDKNLQEGNFILRSVIHDHQQLQCKWPAKSQRLQCWCGPRSSVTPRAPAPPSSPDSLPCLTPLSLHPHYRQSSWLLVSREAGLGQQQSQRSVTAQGHCLSLATLVTAQLTRSGWPRHGTLPPQDPNTPLG